MLLLQLLRVWRIGRHAARRWKRRWRWQRLFVGWGKRQSRRPRQGRVWREPGAQWREGRGRRRRWPLRRRRRRFRSAAHERGLRRWRRWWCLFVRGTERDRRRKLAGSTQRQWRDRDLLVGSRLLRQRGYASSRPDGKH